LITAQKTDYNRTAALEFDYLSKDGKWSVLGKADTSLNPEKYRDNYFFGGGMAYTSRNFNMLNWVNSVGRNYIADMGYVPRLYHENALEDTTIRTVLFQYLRRLCKILWRPSKFCHF